MKDLGVGRILEGVSFIEKLELVDSLRALDCGVDRPPKEGLTGVCGIGIGSVRELFSTAASSRGLASSSQRKKSQRFGSVCWHV